MLSASARCHRRRLRVCLGGATSREQLRDVLALIADLLRSSPEQAATL
jgi:hypothetical protein